MAKKKRSEPSPIDEQKALEARVDAMMDPRLEKSAKAAPVPEKMTVDDVKQQIEQNISLPPEDKKPEPVKVIAVPAQFEPKQTAPELPGSKKKATTKAKAKTQKPEHTPEPEAQAVSDKEFALDPEAPTHEAELEPRVNIDNQQTDEAVDDIVVHESDTVLAVEDAQRAKKQRDAEAEAPKKSGVLATFWLALEIVLIMAIGASIAALIMYGV